MLHKTRGIVLHTIKYTETSIITKIYTETFGLQSYIVNGVRSSRSKSNASHFMPMNILELEIYRKEHKNLQRIREYWMARVFKNIPFDIIKSSIAMFLAEVINKVIQGEERNSPMYLYIEDALIKLDEENSYVQNFHLRFLLDLTKHLGFYPSRNFNEYNCFFDLHEGRFVNEAPVHKGFIPPPLSKSFHELLEGSVGHVNYADRNKLLEKILFYYALHVENFGKINSHVILHEVLS